MTGFAASENASLARALSLAAAVPDPEIPVLSLGDLGVVREVLQEDGRVVVLLTPTYTACPATEVIADDIRSALVAGGFEAPEVRIVLAPAWTTDWITEEGRRKLREYGITPPGPRMAESQVIRFMPGVAAPARGPACPRCDSDRTEQIAAHGSTPCKSLWRCLACREPFDYFKPY